MNRHDGACRENASPNMSPDATSAFLLPRRCGNCRHAVRSASLDGTIVACLIHLQYHCADRVPDCASYCPALNPAEFDVRKD